MKKIYNGQSILFLIMTLMCTSVITVTQSQTLQSAFPDANGSVYAIASSGTTVFVGGNFTTIGGIARNGLAAVNGTTGAILSWNPNPTRSGGATVRSLAISSNGLNLYVGGIFTSIGGQTRNHLAKIDLATGNADATWDPNVNGIEGVEKMSVSSGDTVFFYGKDFTQINGSVSRPGSIAAVKGTGTGEATAFNPAGFVPITTRYIQVSPEGSTLYLGYNSTGVTWSSLARNYFVALNTTDGSATDMSPGFNQGVFCSAIVGTTIYFGGQFTSINGNFDIQKIAKYDASGGWSNPTLVTTWNNTSATTPDGDIRAIVYSANGSTPLLYLGGGFHTIGITAREKLAAIKLSDASVQNWNPTAVIQGALDMRMNLSTVNQKIYIADFTTSILGTSRSYLSAVDGGTDPLPVEFTSFSARPKGTSIELLWKTATEVNNYGFEIERKPARISPPCKGGDNRGGWTKVGFIEGNGTTNAPKSYSYTDHSANGYVAYRLKQIDRDGKFEYSQEVESVISQIPQSLSLMQNYPNPFNPATVISYQLPANGYVSLKVFDAIGREVATLVDEVKEAGTYSKEFDASKLSSGVYFAKLSSAGKTQIKKMSFLK